MYTKQCTPIIKKKRIEKFDAKNSTLDEERYQAIGMVEEVLFVAYTERARERIRLISARPAEQEEKNYEEWCKQFYN